MAATSDHRPDHRPPADLCLLLRAHAEARWLTHEVVPLVRQLEQRDRLSEEELAATRAYLEVLWAEACGRAALTEASSRKLDSSSDRDRTPDGDRAAAGELPAIDGRARRYHLAARRLREAVAHRVSELRALPGDLTAGNDSIVSIGDGSIAG